MSGKQQEEVATAWGLGARLAARIDSRRGVSRLNHVNNAAPFATLSMTSRRRRVSGNESCVLVAAKSTAATKKADPKATKKAAPAKGGKNAKAASAKEEKHGLFGTMSPLEVIGNMAAGASAGAAVETALYPIDTIKTRLQAARSGQQIVWKGLYKGLAGNIFGVIPASALFFGVYEPVKQAMLRREKEGSSGFVAHLCAAAAAGTAASLVRVPTEVVKQRMQTGQFTSAVGAVRSILASEGLRKGLYAGYGSFLLRDLPFDAIEFVGYEQMKGAVARISKRECTGIEISAIGAGAGIATAVLTTPLDVIKTRLMTQGAAGRYAGIFDCCSKIIREEGAKAMFKGVGPRVLWIGIGGSIFFTSLEASRVVYLKALGVEAKPKGAH